jgi:hypothetical protein
MYMYIYIKMYIYISLNIMFWNHETCMHVNIWYNKTQLFKTQHETTWTGFVYDHPDIKNECVYIYIYKYYICCSTWGWNIYFAWVDEQVRMYIL